MLAGYGTNYVFDDFNAKTIVEAARSGTIFGPSTAKDAKGGKKAQPKKDKPKLNDNVLCQLCHHPVLDHTFTKFSKSQTSNSKSLRFKKSNFETVLSLFSMVCHSHESLLLLRKTNHSTLDPKNKSKSSLTSGERKAMFRKVRVEASEKKDDLNVLHRFVQTRLKELTGTLEKLSAFVEEADRKKKTEGPSKKK